MVLAGFENRLQAGVLLIAPVDVVETEECVAVLYRFLEQVRVLGVVRFADRHLEDLAPLQSDRVIAR